MAVVVVVITEEEDGAATVVVSSPLPSSPLPSKVVDVDVDIEGDVMLDVVLLEATEDVDVTTGAVDVVVSLTVVVGSAVAVAVVLGPITHVPPRRPSPLSTKPAGHSETQRPRLRNVFWKQMRQVPETELQ